jgi:hypothetical protein
MQLRTGSENNDHLPRQDRDEHRESSKTGRCFVFLSIAETVEISRLLDKVKTRAVCAICILKPSFYQDRLGTNIGKALKKRTVLLQDELSELMQRADLPLARQLSSSGSGAAGGSGGAGSSREGMRNRIATALRLQLAPPSKGSIRNYFQRAAPPPPAQQQQQPAAAAAAAGSAGVLVTNVCAAPLRSQLRAAVLAACGACIQLEPEFVELLQKVELLFYLGKSGERNASFAMPFVPGIVQTINLPRQACDKHRRKS